jgi:hypothetical protein
MSFKNWSSGLEARRKVASADGPGDKPVRGPEPTPAAPEPVPAIKEPTKGRPEPEGAPDRRAASPPTHA